MPSGKITARYKYYLRPGYGSDELLIEFITGVEHKNFESDLQKAISGIEPKLIEVVDHMMVNDEWLYKYSSLHGNFDLSKSCWDIAFIITDNNQDCIKKINKLLENHFPYEKVEVDFEKYKLEEGTRN
jgi:hypothetical protein